ncbi:MAG: hypothetical protein HY335_08445 [Deinococcus sp.]|nr:hypothetical protein [Deinococcus sp.]
MTATGLRPYLKIAHRGASAHEPENTIRAFLRAVELGADYSEMDVHLSQDGHPVIIHDARLERTTNGRGLVHEKTLAELKTLDAGKGERIPTLQEVCEALRGRSGLYLELKGVGTPGPTYQVLHQCYWNDRVFAGSFKPDLIRQFRAIAPWIPTSLLIKETQGRFLEATKELGATYAHLCWEDQAPQPHRLITPELIARARELGLGIMAWHEERASEIRELAKLPIQGVFSNNPEML